MIRLPGGAEFGLGTGCHPHALSAWLSGECNTPGLTDCLSTGPRTSRRRLRTVGTKYIPSRIWYNCGEEREAAPRPPLYGHRVFPRDIYHVTRAPGSKPFSKGSRVTPWRGPAYWGSPHTQGVHHTWDRSLRPHLGPVSHQA